MSHRQIPAGQARLGALIQMDERKNKKRRGSVTENKRASEREWRRKMIGEKAAGRKEVTR